MKTIKDSLTHKITKGGIIRATRIIVEEFTCEEHLNTLFKIERAIEESKNALEQNTKLLNCLEGNKGSIKKFAQKVEDAKRASQKAEREKIENSPEKD